MNKLEEFWYCVAPQEDLPLYKGHAISSSACTNLINFINEYKLRIGSGTPTEVIQSIILENPNIISDIRVQVGVSDKRLYLDLTYLVNVFNDTKKRRFVPEEREHLLKHNTKYFYDCYQTHQ